MTTRTNYVVNPSLEVNATSWESNSAFGGYDVSTIARSTAQAWVGTASLQVTAPTSVAGKTWANTTAIPVINGQLYTFSAYVRSATAATFYADAVFMEKGPNVAVPANTWTRVSVTFVANSTNAFCGVGITGAASGFVYYVDGALLERGSTLGAYFDGATTDTVDIFYDWTGTAHASTSTEISPDPPITERLSALDVLRLEVEADPEPGQLVNLVQNPSGELGGYGWNSVQDGAYITGVHDEITDPSRWYLQYIGSTFVGASFFRTESMPMVAGQYVAARWHYIESGANAYRARLSFLDANGSVISSTTYFSYSSATNEVDANTGPFLAPANTVAVRLAFEVGDTGGVYPITIKQATMSLTDVTVAVAATSAALGTTRTNTVVNPSAETNANNWVAINGTMTRAAAPSPLVAGSWAFRCVKTAGGVGLYLAESLTGAAAHGATAGNTWRARAQVRLGSTIVIGSLVAFRMEWFNAAGDPLTSPVNTSFGHTTVTATDVWIPLSATVQVPTGATRMRLQVYVVGANNTAVPTNGVMVVDAISLERESANATAYFDGSTTAAGGWSYSWTGTTNNSTSTATSSNLGFVEPVPYLDVLGDMREASWVREELNVGTLSAVVVNPDLSPAIAETLRPGRRFRMMMNPNPDSMLLAVGGYTESLIVGKLSNAKVDYRPLETDPARRAIISLTAVDAIALLANAKRPNTVGKVIELPYVLEGAGVPWVCDGQASQISSANVVVINDGASALDQVAITRDTAGGYAWVDRRGVLQVVSGFPDPTAEKISNGSLTSPVTFVASSQGNNGWAISTLATATAATPTPASPNGGTAARLVPTGSFALCRLGAKMAEPYVGVSFTDYGATPVGPGQTYKATAYVMSNVARSAFLIADCAKDDFGTLATYSATATSTVGSWTLLELEFTTPPGTAMVYLRAEFGVLGGPNLPNTDIHWVDGVTLKATRATPYDLDESVYNANFVVDYDTDRMINSIEIHRQWTHPSEGPQETVYGPYTDATSVSEWGIRHASVTVAGTAVSAIPALAAAILAKNATPEVRVQSLQIPINRDTLQFALIDLYDLVHVSNESVGIDTLMRVTGINNQVVANPDLADDDRWLMTLGFASENGIATPTAAPALPSSAVDTELYVDLAKNGSTFSVPQSAATVPTGWTQNSNVGGGTLAGSSKVITVSGMHNISGTATFVLGASGRRTLILQVGGVDVARDEVATGSRVTLHASNAVWVDAGQTVQMQVFQDSVAGGLNLSGNAADNHFTVFRLGG